MENLITLVVTITGISLLGIVLYLYIRSGVDAEYEEYIREPIMISKLGYENYKEIRSREVFVKATILTVTFLLGVGLTPNARNIGRIVAKTTTGVEPSKVILYVEDLENYKDGEIIEVSDKRFLYHSTVQNENGTLKPLKKDKATYYTMRKMITGKSNVTFIQNKTNEYKVEQSGHDVLIKLTDEIKYEPSSKVLGL